VTFIFAVKLRMKLTLSDSCLSKQYSCLEPTVQKLHNWMTLVPVELSNGCKMLKVQTEKVVDALMDVEVRVEEWDWVRRAMRQYFRQETRE
jgi:hypothetical protein